MKLSKLLIISLLGTPLLHLIYSDLFDLDLAMTNEYLAKLPILFLILLIPAFIAFRYRNVYISKSFYTFVYYPVHLGIPLSLINSLYNHTELLSEDGVKIEWEFVAINIFLFYLIFAFVANLTYRSNFNKKAN
ncbi:hypothetical protein OAQ99_05600 [Candidatus Kapabacteria bacterium]|nr:hypothetical protein [Candidatus Kapabacteria bacterium]